jgi:predicted AAA+ superfamily ATPase
MRRVGKSRILELIRQRLLSEGIQERSIFFMNKELLEWDAIRNYTDLWESVRRYFGEIPGKRYVFIDEIQEIMDWERAVVSMLADGYADVVISGSNAHLLSSELSTLLVGRYIEFHVYPLGFREFLHFRGTAAGDEKLEFLLFMRYGGLPGIHAFPLGDETVFPYLMGIYSTIVLRDVVSRHALRDPEQLERIIRFLFDNCGNITSAKRLADFLKGQGMKTGMDKVLAYITFLEQAYLVQRTRRFDLRGLRHLETLEKFYMGDIGLRHGFMGYRDQDISGLLENVVYLELARRGYHVSVGKWDELEVDFVAEKAESRIYVQVAYMLSTVSVINREYAPLEKIQDNHPKYVVTLDEDQQVLRKGIIHQNIREFLLGD